MLGPTFGFAAVAWLKGTNKIADRYGMLDLSYMCIYKHNSHKINICTYMGIHT